MANKYLRGTGARNWNDTANWSDTSGGAGGASVPTASDNVIFDANSGTGTITVNAISNMLDFTCTNIGALTISNAAYAFNVYGSLTLHTSLTVNFTSTGYLYLKATDSRSITTNGKVANWNRLYFDGVGGTWTNQDDMNVGACGVYHANGTWITNNYNITNTSDYLTQPGTKTLTLGSSIFRLIFKNNFATNFTFNYDTSTVYCDTYGSYQIQGNTFYNLIIYSNYNIISSNLGIVGNITIINNLTITGYPIIHYLIASNIIGTARTITCNGTVTASNVDFRDIILTGTCNKDLSAISGGSGDCGGNSGITFTTAQPQYFKKYASTANYGDAANWFSDLALTVAGRVPLPQDLGSKFIATSFNQTCTVSCNVPRIPCLDMSEVANAVTWSLANAVEVYGSYVLGANITITHNDLSNKFMSRINYNINTYGKNHASFAFYCVGATATMLSNTIIKYNTTIYNGNVDFNDFDLTCQYITSEFSTNWIAGNGILFLNNAATLESLKLYGTFTPEGSTIKLIPALGNNNITFAGLSKTFNKIQISGSHTGSFDITGNNTIAELIIDSGRKVRFTAGTTQTIGKITYGSGITQDCVTAGTYNLALTEIATAENANIKGCVVTQDSKLFAEANSVDSGSNNRVVFGDYFTVQEIIL